MDLEEQERIKQAVEDNGGPDGIVAILGSPDAESAGMFAETISLGDPTYAGALAGVSLRLPVYHITEPEVRAIVGRVQLPSESNRPAGVAPERG